MLIFPTEKFESFGLNIQCYHSCMLEKDKNRVKDYLLSKYYLNMLYVAPESFDILFSDFTQIPNRNISNNSSNDNISDNDLYPIISYIVFDEAHVISESTFLFRNKYAYHLKQIIEHLSQFNVQQNCAKPQIIALTASCTKNDEILIRQRLGIEDNGNSIISKTWKRDNLDCSIVKNQTFSFVMHFVLF